MKTRLTLFFLLIVSITQAQYNYYYDDPAFGVGFGTNLTSIVGEDVHPTEISLRYRINSSNMLQLLVPILRQKNSFQSQGHTNFELIETSLDTEKQLYGIGLDYDYALQRFASFDFVIGLRAEYQRYKYTSNLTNSHLSGSSSSGNDYGAAELTFYDKKTRNYIISPNVGLRLKWKRVSIDTKFLLSMLSIRGYVDNRIEAREPSISSKVSITKEWTDHISNKFKLKPGVVISTSYFF